jgi:hypothetical protein
MWDYDPKKATECLPEGDYAAELAEVEETTSKKGNAMLVVTWTVYQSSDRTHRVLDYIVNPGGLFKLKGIARAWQLLHEFDAANFDIAAHKGRLITLRLTVQTSEQYPDRNNVAGYALATIEAEQAAIARPAVEAGEEIPFAWLLPMGFLLASMAPYC